ncbi:MAG: DsbA family protein [Pseudomonadota bacterium]
MTLEADLYFSFRSPYSYLAIGRYRAMVQEHDLKLRLKTVFPIAIRDPGFFEREDPQWLPYLVRDIARVAQFQGLPIALPQPDPVNMDLRTREISDDQPLIRPISYLGVEAERRGKGLAFAAEAAGLIWGGTKDWNKDEILGPACARCDLDLDDMRASIAADEASYEAEIEANQAALENAGHWGVPTLVFESEPFFGQDRIEMVLWRLKQRGLTSRTL